MRYFLFQVRYFNWLLYWIVNLFYCFTKFYCFKVSVAIQIIGPLQHMLECSIWRAKQQNFNVLLTGNQSFCPSPPPIWQLALVMRKYLPKLAVSNRKWNAASRKYTMRAENIRCVQHVSRTTVPQKALQTLLSQKFHGRPEWLTPVHCILCDTDGLGDLTTMNYRI